jgi:glutaminase
MDLASIVNLVYNEIKSGIGKGKVADYIPALAKVPINKFGIAVKTNDGSIYSAGDVNEPFSIQSISKVLLLTLAMDFIGDEIWNRVGREPSGNPFNSLVQLERENGIPRNPFINAGSLVITDMVISHSNDAKKLLLDFVRNLSNNPLVNYDFEVAQSEKEHGFRNAALANFMKSYGNIENQVELVLDYYFHHCSLSMSCIDLVNTFSYLANSGIDVNSGKRILSKELNQRVNSLMLTCGLYDAVGDFAYRVGLPAKSGVGGGIITVVPNEMIIAVWSPGLDKVGNSVMGIDALEKFVKLTNKSIF